MTTSLKPHLRDAVERELEGAPEMDASGVGVTATDGVVTLTGVVPTYADKIAAERAALRVWGVRAVANDIQVKADGHLTDTEIAEDAVRALWADGRVPTGIKISVRDGVVALDGTVETMLERQAAESAVRRRLALPTVSNQITVRA